MNENSSTRADGVDLSHLDEEYARAEVPETEEVPDGRYQVSIERVKLTQAQSTGNPMLRWVLRILGPSHRDRLLWKNSVMTANTLEYLKKDLQTCGLSLQRLSDLPNHLGDLLDLKLEVVKKTRGDSVNMYINKKIVVDDEPTGYRNAAADAMTPF